MLKKRQYFTKIYEFFKCIKSALVSTENMDPAFYVNVDQDLFQTQEFHDNQTL